MTNIILKIIFLIMAVMYGYSNTAKVFKGQRVTGIQIFLMALGIVGFVSIHFEWIVF